MGGMMNAGGMGGQGAGMTGNNMMQDQAMRLAQARMMKGMGPRMMPGMPQGMGGNQAGNMSEQQRRAVEMMIMQMMGGQ